MKMFDSSRVRSTSRKSVLVKGRGADCFAGAVD